MEHFNSDNVIVRSQYAVINLSLSLRACDEGDMTPCLTTPHKDCISHQPDGSL